MLRTNKVFYLVASLLLLAFFACLGCFLGVIVSANLTNKDADANIEQEKIEQEQESVLLPQATSEYTLWTRNDQETYTFKATMESSYITSVSASTTSGNVGSTTCTIYVLPGVSFSGFSYDNNSNWEGDVPRRRSASASVSSYGSGYIKLSLSTSWSGKSKKGRPLTLHSTISLSFDGNLSSNANLSVSPTSYTYDGNAKQPTPTVSYPSSSSHAYGTVSSSYYDVSYSNQYNAGTATCTITGKSGYSGSKSATYTINKASNSWATTPGINSWTYGQTAQNPYGQATYSGTKTYYYKLSSASSYSTTKPSTPGTYNFYCNDAGDLNHVGISSSETTFYIYAPTPTVATNYQWRNSQISASSTYNSTYVNAPSGVTGTDVGSYTATFTTKSGYLFNNGTTSYSTSWSIIKRSVPIDSVSGSFVFDGTTKTCAINENSWNNSGDTGSSSDYYTRTGDISAINAGTYTVTFTLINTTFSQWADGTTAPKSSSWTITRNPAATKPTASGGTSYTFTGSSITHGVSNYNTTYMTRSGTPSATNAGSYSVTYTLNSNYAWKDGSTGAVTLNWTITPKALTKPSIKTNPTYTGSAVSPTLNNYDSNTMSQSGDTSGTTVKSYTLTIALKNTSNYKWSDNTTASFNLSWSVGKMSITIPTVSGSFTYDGTQKSATITNMNSTYITQGGSATGTNAGTYTITFTLKDTANTQWSGGSTAVQSKTWTISQRDISGATVTLPQTDYTYDGSAKQPDPTVIV